MRARSDPTMNSPAHRDFTLEPDDTERLANLAGPFDAHLRQIELKLGVEIANRGNIFRVTGPEPAITAAQTLLTALYEEAASTTFDNHAIHLRLNDANVEQVVDRSYVAQDVAIKVKRGTVRGRGITRPSTCMRSPRTTSISASARPVLARPSWPWPARSRR